MTENYSVSPNGNVRRTGPGTGHNTSVRSAVPAQTSIAEIDIKSKKEPTKNNINRDVGSLVIYPGHGVAKIVSISNKLVRGESKEYLELKTEKGNLTIWVMTSELEKSGVRDFISGRDLEAVYKVLSTAPQQTGKTSWSSRYRSNLEKLASDDTIKIAEVIRDLWTLEGLRTISAGEKRMLLHSLKLLFPEVIANTKAETDIEAETILRSKFDSRVS